MRLSSYSLVSVVYELTMKWKGPNEVTDVLMKKIRDLVSGRCFFTGGCVFFSLFVCVVV